MCQALWNFAIFIHLGLILITKRPTVVAFSSTAFVMDTSFQRPNYDTEDVCKAQHEKDAPTILVDDPWVHAGETSTIMLKCRICATHPFAVWWTKSGKKLPQESFRIRQIHNHHKENEFALKIRGLRSQDFGEYECNVYSNRTRIQRSAALNVTGVPYPAIFDLPTNWSDTTFKLSWRVNCSINAPIINYQLEFKEVPHGEWVVINIPAEIDYDDNNFHNQYKNRRRKSKKHSDIVQFKQSYNIRGLTKGSSYKARIRSRNEFGMSAETILDHFSTFDIQGEKRTTESTTNIFQKISIIDSQVNEKVYFQDEQPIDTSTVKVPFDNGFLSKDIVNSEPLSTIKERVFPFGSSGAASLGGKSVLRGNNSGLLIISWTIFLFLLRLRNP